MMIAYLITYLGKPTVACQCEMDLITQLWSMNKEVWMSSLVDTI